MNASNRGLFRNRNRPARRGIATVWLLAALPVFVLILMLVVDVGNVWVARVELENSLEAASLAAARSWGTSTNVPMSNWTAPSRARAQALAAANAVRGTSLVVADNLGVFNSGSNPNENASPLGTLTFGMVNAAETTFADNVAPIGPTDYSNLYPFTANANDAVGGAHGTLIGDASVVSGRLVLDGTGDYVQLPAQIIPNSGDYTVALYAQIAAPQGTFSEFISQGSSGGPGFYLGADFGSNRIRAGDQWPNTGVPLPSDGQFHHYTLTVNSAGSDSRLYLDGVLVATLGTAITSAASGSNTRLGAQFGGAASEFLNGRLDDVRVYNRTLTALEVSRLAAKHGVRAQATVNVASRFASAFGATFLPYSITCESTALYDPTTQQTRLVRIGP